jgi:SAM-dependent methyltransferase
MMAHGVKLAKDGDLNVRFAQMPCEKMTYEADTFDIIFCRDILHHVDIHATMKEITRVARPGALLVVDEIYSHSITDRIRHSWFVERFVYPMVRKWIYRGKIFYITEDERKMTEDDIDLVKSYIEVLLFRKYFNLISARFVSDTVAYIAKADRACLYILGPLGRYLGGRATFAGYLPNRK